jgi:hypothetical protein
MQSVIEKLENKHAGLVQINNDFERMHAAIDDKEKARNAEMDQVGVGVGGWVGEAACGAAPPQTPPL